MLRCQACGAHKKSRCGLEFTNFNSGVGNPHAPIMVVFDSIFVADMSNDRFFSEENYRKWMTDILHSVNVVMEDCYFTALVKCLGGTDKKTNKVFLKRCVEEHLKRELEDVKPKVIVAVGLETAKFFVPELKILGDGIGHNFIYRFEDKECRVIPVYDMRFLAGLTADSPRYRPVQKALSKIPELLGGIVPIEPDTVVSEDYNKLEQLGDIVGVDTETTGLDPLKDKILTVAVSDGKDTVGFDTGNGWDWDRIVAALKKRKLICANGIFDLKMFLTAGVDLLDNFYGDTQLNQYLKSPNGAQSLEYLVSIFYGVNYKGMVNREKMSDEPPEKRIKYCGKDGYYTHEIYFKQLPQIAEQGSANSNKVLTALIPIISDMENRGFLVDKKRLEELTKLYGDRASASLLKFKERFELAADFNINSSQQLGRLFFKKLGLKPTKISKKSKQPSTDEDVVKLLAKKSPGLKHLLDYRSDIGVRRKLATYAAAIREDGKIHSTFWLYSPQSSRIMSSSPNIQNVNREGELKEIFIARPGYTLVYFDFSQIEFRVWIHLAQDLVGAEFVNSGKDIHSHISGRIYKIPEGDVTEEQRDKTKTGVYGSLYGSTPENVALIFDIDVELARQVQKIFFGMCKKGYLWLKQIEHEAQANGYVKTPFGSYKFVPDIGVAFKGKKEELLRQCKNFIVQSWAVELVYISMIKLFKAMRREGIVGGYVHQIHDATITEVRNDCVERQIELIKQYVPNPVKLIVPLDVEIKIGESWGKLKKLKNKDGSMLDVKKYLEDKQEAVV